uniref:NADH-ubiquinone oxidoreductase chain 4L n=1 Tax=Hexanchus griseus TaxID=94987 RepID=U6C3W3_9CHON|nr:NADH dehydrogenase subunit 4L [Hexanchus griseus]AHH30358.1 NADH dehydrogenase subunit 4L [Hexanchus griseus]WNH19574.1 NADH dehydrogenase subunit 4L [Hexanchus griseus]BAO02747.1 NADH dehydrogenase subunit 4L [Hexanchus griseus]
MSILYFSLYSAFILALMGLAFHRTHLLSALLCLEGMMLSLFIFISIWSMMLNCTSHSIAPMILLTFSACEAGTGLALLVATTRTHGSDHLQNLNLLQC